MASPGAAPPAAGAGAGAAADDDDGATPLPSDAVPPAHDKTDTDVEHDIKFMVEEARAAALRGNLFKAESLLKRACKVTARLHGPAHLELAAHLSKLAAVQQQAGKLVESKLSWNRSLYIFEMNRAPSPSSSADSPHSPARRKARRKRIAREVAALDGGGSALSSASAVPRDAESRVAREKRERKEAEEEAATVLALRGPKPKVPLQALFKIPHQSMSYADAAIINTSSIQPDDLTPRTRQAVLERGVNPDHLRIRDLHSFYAAHPKMPLPERKRRFVQWAKRREWLWKELLEDRYVIQLSEESAGRVDEMERQMAVLKAKRKAKIFGLDKAKNFDPSGATRSVLPPPRWDFQFKGSVAAAIDASEWFQSRPCCVCPCRVVHKCVCVCVLSQARTFT